MEMSLPSSCFQKTSGVPQAKLFWKINQMPSKMKSLRILKTFSRKMLNQAKNDHLGKLLESSVESGVNFVGFYKLLN